ncbi:hypothetical protein ACFQNE_08620 [Gordonia phosphorivorans]|uniref:Uncharacterized protein n=1 Tax=Gordonia phosphorivorans TaxID=1056982 RepID=A0ABV6H8B2_9ACTN
MVAVVSVDREIKDWDIERVVPEWFCGTDGQFVVVDQHLWIAREGDLPTGAGQHPAKRVPLIEVAMFTVVDGARKGEQLVRPVLVTDDAILRPKAENAESVTLAVREFTAFRRMAAREGIAVANLVSGRRIAAAVVAPERTTAPDSVDSSVRVPTPERVDSLEVQARDERARWTAAAVAGRPRSSGGVTTSEVRTTASSTYEPATPTGLPRTRPVQEEMIVPVGMPDGLKVAQPVSATAIPVIAVSVPTAGAESCAEAPPADEAHSGDVQAVVSPEVQAGMQQVIGRFGGVALQEELAKHATSETKWVTHSARREATVSAIAMRVSSDAVSWFEVAQKWVAVGGRPSDEKELLRREAIAESLRALELSAGTALDGSTEAERQARALIGSDRFDRLMNAFGRRRPRKSTTEAPRRATKRRSKQSSPACQQDRPLPTVSETQSPVMTPHQSRETSGVATSVRTAAPSGQAPARFGDKARVRVDIEGFRTVAVVDLRNWAVEVTAGELRGSTFRHPTSALNAVIERTAVGHDRVSDGLDHWMLDDASGQLLRDVVST